MDPDTKIKFKKITIKSFSLKVTGIFFVFYKVWGWIFRPHKTYFWEQFFLPFHQTQKRREINDAYPYSQPTTPYIKLTLPAPVHKNKVCTIKKNLIRNNYILSKFENFIQIFTTLFTTACHKGVPFLHLVQDLDPWSTSPRPTLGSVLGLDLIKFISNEFTSIYLWRVLTYSDHSEENEVGETFPLWCSVVIRACQFNYNINISVAEPGPSLGGGSDLPPEARKFLRKSFMLQWSLFIWGQIYFQNNFGKIYYRLIDKDNKGTHLK